MDWAGSSRDRCLNRGSLGFSRSKASRQPSDLAWYSYCWPGRQSKRSTWDIYSSLRSTLMFERISTSWELAQSSWQVLREDKKLLVFPLLSGIGCLLVMAGFATP